MLYGAKPFASGSSFSVAAASVAVIVGISQT